MGDITISLETLLWICAAIGTVAAAFKILSAPLRKLNGKFEKYDELLSNDKKRLDRQEEILNDIKKDLRIQGDMTYQILDHMATHNNTGGMKAALDKYNSFYRHNDKEN